MESKAVYIRDLKFHNEAELSNTVLGAEVENVNINKKERRMSMSLLSDNIIEDRELENLKSSIEGRFSYFNSVEVKIRYSRSFCDCKDEYCVDIIKKMIPSAKGWAKGLNIKADCGNVELRTESIAGYERMKEEKIDIILSDRIEKEFGERILVKIILTESADNIEIHAQTIAKEEEDFRRGMFSSSESAGSTSGFSAPSSPSKDSAVRVAQGGYNTSNGQKPAGGFAKNGWQGGSGQKRSRSIIKEINGEITPLKELNSHSGTVIIEGEIFDISIFELKDKRRIYTISITDYSASMMCKMFLNEKQEEELADILKNGKRVRFRGNASYDDYSKCLTVMTREVQEISRVKRQDNAEVKRVELHCHSRMSSMDGMTGAGDIVKRAAEWGHKAIAITDHGVVQGFPEAMYAADGKDIKVIYGVEGYLVKDDSDLVDDPGDRDLKCGYVVFDIETTGFSHRNDKIIEIGAVKIENGIITDEFSELINPERHIPDKVIELTGITDPDVENCETIDTVLPRFMEFIGDSVLVAHNADFDTSFIRTKLQQLTGERLNNPTLDTLAFARALYPGLRNHKLNTVSKHLDVSLLNHHRAVDDSRATAQILLKMLEKVEEEGIATLDELNGYYKEHFNVTKCQPNHIIILAKNQAGLKNLYKIISESHINYFYRKPRIPRTVLNEHRDGLIIGSACEAGELYQSILKNENPEKTEKIAAYYDFLEIQPIGNNEFRIRSNDVGSAEELQDFNRYIVELGDKLNKPVVATGDVHFLDKHDEAFRRILMEGQGFGDAEEQAPLYFKTTEEMLQDFAYLGEERAREVVIDNPNAIADSIDELKPIPDGTYPPEIEGADEELRKMNYDRAREIYGEDLPEIVEARLERELNSIISNGYAVMYIIAQKLVKKSNDDGYLVGSRGSVGSSFVATMSGITEVNPLVPHYICPNCKHSEFITDESVGSGVDLPDKDCPSCGTEMIKDGHNIPFEVFLGFEGDKEPDIDLNFAGEYQPNAHKYTEELFGTGYVFRAGTIGTVAEKTAYGYVKKYFDNKEESVHPAEINRLVKGCTGIKRTSGQHPGGVMVVPSYKDIYDFSPIQYPADDKESEVITTHFDYNAISGRILKLDILGHDAPSIIRMLEDFTGVDSSTIRLDDERTKQIFLGTEVLGVEPKQIGSEVGTYGIPEFGTKFVRQMLEDTRPTTFSELVRISGLSHGTDVWLNNAQDLVRNGVATLSEVICTRDDIMNYLIHANLEKKHSFKIMEKVRKGKGLSEEDEQAMVENNVPDWYIDSCKKIKYMFPKAHAVAYVMMSFRIAYFKVYYPEAFYATHFTTKVADFDAELILKGEEAVRDKIKELEDLGINKSAKEKNLLGVLEVALEMYCRGYKFERVDIYKSDSDKFKIGENGIIPPLKSLDGVGESVSRSIAKEREKGKFISIEDLTKRAKCSKTVIEALKLHGCLAGMQDTNQIDLFSFGL